jgi:uncharacterized protein (DUF1778 family)
VKTDRVELRMSEQEKRAFQMAADLSGIRLSSWIRERLRSAARRELVDAGQKVPFLQDREG